MKKILLPLLLSSLLFADCTPQEEQKAMRIWKQSIHKTSKRKLKLLNRAEKICPLELINVDKKIIEAGNAPTLSKLKYLKNANNLLSLDVENQAHKYNNGKQIDQLFLKYFTKEQQELKHKKGVFDLHKNDILNQRINILKGKASDNTLKTIGELGGTYKANLLFDKALYNIKDHSLSQEIVAVIHDEVQKDNNTLFGLEGGASSEGSSSFNKKLSKNRAKALEKEILDIYPNYKNHIKVFAMGESELVCEGDLLPEKNSQGEYECLTQENREKSRRVSIRRLR